MKTDSSTALTDERTRWSIDEEKLIALCRQGIGMHAESAPEYIVCDALLQRLESPGVPEGLSEEALTIIAECRNAFPVPPPNSHLEEGWMLAINDPENVPGYLREIAASHSGSGWQPIESAPKDGRTLLLGYSNSLGNWRTLRGSWMSDDYIAENWEEPENGDAGWFETSVENDYPPNCWATDPTHWQPLPKPPFAAIKEGNTNV